MFGLKGKYPKVFELAEERLEQERKQKSEQLRLEKERQAREHLALLASESPTPKKVELGKRPAPALEEKESLGLQSP